VSAGEALSAAILSDDGWPYASSVPIDADDPGRFHALFGRDSLIFSLQVRQGVLGAIDRLGDAPELYAVGSEGPEPIAIANRVQAWTVGARSAFEQRWDGRRTA
jgi:hypothetical protein